MQHSPRPYRIGELAERAGVSVNETPAEEIKAVEEEWAVLLAEVRAAHNLDPSSAEAKAIAARWDELFSRTMSYYAGKPELGKAIRRNYANGGFEGDGRRAELQ